jgi:hypothetical protein
VRPNEVEQRRIPSKKMHKSSFFVTVTHEFARIFVSGNPLPLFCWEVEEEPQHDVDLRYDP